MNNIKGIDKIVKQENWDYSKNLSKIKPNYLIHGDDWKVGIQKKTREKVIKQLKKWNGKLIEVAYTKHPDIVQRKKSVKNLFLNPESRVSRLKRLNDSKNNLRFIE